MSENKGEKRSEEWALGHTNMWGQEDKEGASKEKEMDEYWGSRKTERDVLEAPCTECSKKEKEGIITGSKANDQIYDEDWELIIGFSNRGNISDFDESTWE